MPQSLSDHIQLGISGEETTEGPAESSIHPSLLWQSMPWRDVIFIDNAVYMFATLMTFLIQLTFPAYLGHPAPDKMSQDAYFPLHSAA